MTLADSRETLLEDVKDQLAVVAAGHPVKDLGDVFEQAARDFQAIACCNLLLNADRKGFQKHLVWAGLAQRTFLTRSRQQGNTVDFRLARSRWESLYCAVAAADDALAGEIHAVAPLDWVPDGEYQENFAYHLFVSLLAAAADAASCASALKRFETALAGSDSVRLDICRAMHGRDGAAFEDAFARLVEARTAEIREDRESTSEHDVAFEPLASVFVEGLALLRIAARLVLISGPRDHPLCPSIAWVKPAPTRPDDLFAEIEQQLRR